MADFVFTSPGVKFKERSIDYVTRSVGITTLGLVGETLKGPAFEPVFVQDKTQFSSRFGAQSIKRFQDGSLQYQLPYVANAFLEEAQQLYITRVLGLSGYQAGTAWNITLDAGVDLAVTGTTTVNVAFGATGFTNNQFLGAALSGLGSTGTYDSGWNKSGNTFTLIKKTFVVITYNSGASSGTTSGLTTTYTGASLTEYENMVLAVVRSRGTSDTAIDSVPVTTFSTTNLQITGNTTIDALLSPTGDVFGEFTLVASSSASTATYKVSLNPNASNFLPNVIGYEPKDKNTKIWVQSVYPDLIKKLDADGIAYGVNTVLVTGSTELFTDYRTTYQTPETPWVVSQLKGSEVDRLFKFISISDGDAGNQEIKISIVNVNPLTLDFDVVIRNFYDTDANISVLETYQKCNMIKGSSNYIGQRIGTNDGEYSLQSKYVMVEIPSELPVNVYPAGFEGFMLNKYDNISGVAPKPFYKTEYQDTDKVNKTYLGVSELGYTGDGINQNLFNFNNFYSGQPSTGFTKSKGFHLDSGATLVFANGVGEFEVGAGSFQPTVDSDSTNPYYNIKSRKFTLVPAGGFDGWDVHRRTRSVTDGYQQGGRYSGYPSQPLVVPKNDFQAWETAIDTFSNPEDVTINLFATPGINWSDQTILVQNTIEMIETQRTDSLYVIDSPIGDVTTSIGDGGRADVEAATQIVSLLEDAEIDSSYACTYYPWIQMRDTQNNVNVYIPATGEVVKAMAFTDNTKAPWFAPAGLNRGVTNARKSMFKLSQEARDIIYAGRINPMADFADAGTAIFGQKTLQVAESALDRINVRRLLLQIKVLIANISIRLVFDQNDQATIDQFLSKVNPILDSIKRERGLLDFRVKMDDSNNTPETKDRNELYGEIQLKPTRSMEFLGVTFTITPSGANFAES